MNGRAAAKAHLFSHSDFLKADAATLIIRDAACFVSLSCFRVRAEPILALMEYGLEKWRVGERLNVTLISFYITVVILNERGQNKKSRRLLGNNPAQKTRGKQKNQRRRNPRNNHKKSQKRRLWNLPRNETFHSSGRADHT